MRQMTSHCRAVGSKHCGCAPPSLSLAAAVTAHDDGVQFSRFVQVMLSGCKFSTEKRNLQICRNHNFPTYARPRVNKNLIFSFSHFLISGSRVRARVILYIYLYLNLLLYIFTLLSPPYRQLSPQDGGDMCQTDSFLTGINMHKSGYL